jgi:hypothetical protein
MVVVVEGYDSAVSLVTLAVAVVVVVVVRV